jgi:hypothetical protein
MAVAVGRVVRHVITEHAPEELVLLESVERMDPGTRRRHLAAMGGRRRKPPSTLDYGLDVVVPLVTPVLWLVLTEAARETAASAVRASAQAMRSRWQRLRGREPEGEPEIMVPLSAEQLGLVREAVLTQCVAAGLGTARATAVANAVFHQLSTSGDRDAPPAEDRPARQDDQEPESE